MLTRLQRMRRTDAGFSLVEVMVGMVLASIVGAMTLAFFMNADGVTSATSGTDQATASARNALQSWAKMLQVAGGTDAAGSPTNGITALSPTSISFTAYLDNSSATCLPDCPPLTATTVSLELTPAGMLAETIGAGAQSVVVPDNTSATGPGGCLFTAYVGTDALGCDGLSAEQLSSVTSVGLSFSVTASGHTRSFQTTAALVG